jgi:G5 domain
MAKQGTRFLRVVAICCFALAAFVPSTLQAHRSGCHRWHSCPSDTGSYVCGDLGYYSECPNTPPQPQPSPPPPKPRPPKITKRTDTLVEPIKFEARTEKTTNEYEGYSTLSQGKDGQLKRYIEKTFTDGRETFSNIVKEEAILQPVPQINLVGIRKRPKTSFSKPDKTHEGKFVFAGKFEPNTDIVLEINGKKVQTTKSDSHGGYKFKEVSVGQGEKIVYMHERKPKGWFWHEDQVLTEKTFFKPSTGAIESDYERIHSKSLKE